MRYPDICIGTATEADHVVALSPGGTDSDFNMQAVCTPCHRRKTSKEGHAAQGY